MPFPILHTYAGYAVYKLTEDKNAGFQWATAFFAIFLANLADFDFIPGVLLQDAARFHRFGSHSIVAAICCGIFFALISYVLKKGSPSKVFVLATAAYGSHILLDCYSGGASLLWPFSDARIGLHKYYVGSSPFLDAKTIPDFLIAMFSGDCLVRMFKELLAVQFCMLMTYVANLVSRQMPFRRNFIHTTSFGVALLVFSVYLWGHL